MKLSKNVSEGVCPPHTHHAQIRSFFPFLLFQSDLDVVCFLSVCVCVCVECNGQGVASLPDVFFSFNVSLPLRIVGCLRTHMHAHTHFHAQTAQVSGCAPVIQVRASGGTEMELGKRGKEIEMEREGM